MAIRPQVKAPDKPSKDNSINSKTEEITKSCSRGKSSERTHQASWRHKGNSVRMAIKTVKMMNMTRINAL
jgi:hypothetical protein